MILKAVFRIRKSFLLIRIHRSVILNYGFGSGRPKLRIRICKKHPDLYYVITDRKKFQKKVKYFINFNNFGLPDPDP